MIPLQCPAQAMTSFRVWRAVREESGLRNASGRGLRNDLEVNLAMWRQDNFVQNCGQCVGGRVLCSREEIPSKSGRVFRF